jgi:hypothetical protein
MLIVVLKGSIIVKLCITKKTDVLAQRYTNCATPLDILITWRCVGGEDQQLMAEHSGASHATVMELTGSS